ncbi:hypothetical protein F5Y18DRAFT_257000 [Xylariaceae sp. FL1019]|nr:hypothetical protein F5Y18DRAFT_257000 [Xylariaceae sp. FL1019]
MPISRDFPMDHGSLLRDLGSRVSDAFDRALSVDTLPDRLSHFALQSEAERFQLWAHNLGLHHYGHASLDYRVRDSEFVRDRLVEFIEELGNHVENLAAIIVGDRVPAEEIDDPPQQDDYSAWSSSSDSDSDIHTEPPSVVDSLHEVDIRLQSITDCLDNLYKLATKIRNPKNRPSRTVQQLFKNSTTDDLDDFIRQREEVEASIISHACREYIYQNIDNGETGGSSEEGLTSIVSRYADPTHWLIRRVGKANARRKQQFVYWKDHATKLSRKHVTPKIADTGSVVPESVNGLKTKALTAKVEPVAPSLTTSATVLPAMMIDDLRSESSHQSSMSSTFHTRDSDITWPAPPQVGKKVKYFECPYCKTLCPANYLRKGEWEKHLIHDLQAYNCTYEYCTDPYRIYGSKGEWVDHESQHTRVWYCADHDVEFEAAQEYISHMISTHPICTTEKLSDELVASVVRPSRNVQRDCPLCPIHFSPRDIMGMQNHMAQHLERLALLTLPVFEYDDTEDENAPVKSEDSQHGQIRGRADSLIGDFGLRFGLVPIPCSSPNLGLYSEKLLELREHEARCIGFYDSKRSCLIFRTGISDSCFTEEYNLKHIRSIGIIGGRDQGEIQINSEETQPVVYVLDSDTNRLRRAVSSSTTIPAHYRISPSDDRDFERFRAVVALISALIRVNREPERNQRQHSDALTSRKLKTVESDEYIDIIQWRQDVESGPAYYSGVYQLDETPNNQLLFGMDYPEWPTESDRIAAEMIARLRKPRRKYSVVRMDPNCAWCSMPAHVACDCEAEQLQKDVEEAEAKVLAPRAYEIREWVTDHVRALFAESAAEHDEGSPSTLDHTLEASEYFFKLVQIDMPDEEDPRMRGPRHPVIPTLVSELEPNYLFENNGEENDSPQKLGSETGPREQIGGAENTSNA